MSRLNRWTSRSIGTRLQHGIFYLLIRVGGRRAAYFLLFWVTLWYMGKPEAARRCAPYLQRRFPDASFFERLRHRWRLQWELGKSLVDRASAGILQDCDVRTSEMELHAIREAYAQEKGLILMSAHIGSWNIAMSILPKSLPAPIDVVLYRDRADYDRHYFEHRGEQPPFTIINPALGAESAIAMVQSLQNKGILCMMGDRTFGNSHVCRVLFLGSLIDIPITPYYLASVTGAPIIVFFSYRAGPGIVHNVIARTIHVPPGLGKKPEVYEPYAREYVRSLEDSVIQKPYQFFNFYNMWDVT